MRLITFLLFLSATTVFGQVNLDSLKTAFLTGNDSIKNATASKLARTYENLNQDSSIKYYNAAYDVCEQNNWYKQMGDARLNESFLYFHVLHSKEWTNYILSAKSLYEKANHPIGVLSCYYNLGTFWGAIDQLDSSIHYLTLGSEYGEEFTDSILLHRIYNNLGLMYQYQGFNDKASEYFIKGIVLAESLQTTDLERAYLNLGLNYYYNKQYKLAIKYFKIAKKGFVAKGYSEGEALSLKNIGDVMEVVNRLDSAAFYYDLALEIFIELEDSNSISRYYLSMSDIYEKQGNEERALESLTHGIAIFPENGSPRLLVFLLNNKSKFQLNTHSEIDAISITQVIGQLLEAEKIAKEIGLLTGQVSASQLLFQAYKTQGNNTKSVIYAEKYIILNDSLTNQTRLKANASQNAKFESQKKELEIDFLNKENALKTTEISQSKELQSKQEYIIYLLFGGIFLTGIFVLVVLKFYRNQRKLNTDLLSKNKVISIQKQEKEILLNEIHHRVKNNLQIIWGLLDLQSHSISDMQVKSAINDGKNRVNSMAMIHTMLYQNDDAGNIYFLDYIRKLMSHISTTHSGAEKVDIQISVPEKLKFDIDTSIPLGLLVTELFTNALKYGINGVVSPKIIISLSAQSEIDYTLKIADNGSGLPEGFDIKNSTSLGLKLVTSLSKQLQGKLVIKNTNGAEFIIQFKGKSFSIT